MIYTIAAPDERLLCFLVYGIHMLRGKPLTLVQNSSYLLRLEVYLENIVQEHEFKNIHIYTDKEAIHKRKQSIHKRKGSINKRERSIRKRKAPIHKRENLPVYEQGLVCRLF